MSLLSNVYHDMCIDSWYFPQVHEYLRSKLCSLYENDCIFDKFECCWSGNDSAIMTGSYNNFFRMFDRTSKRDVTLEASRETAKPRFLLKPRKVRLFVVFSCSSPLFIKTSYPFLQRMWGPVSLFSFIKSKFFIPMAEPLCYNNAQIQLISLIWD